MVGPVEEKDLLDAIASVAKLQVRDTTEMLIVERPVRTTGQPYSY